MAPVLPCLLLPLLLQAQGKPALPKDPSTLVKVAEGAKAPSLAMDADGNAYIVLSRAGNIEVCTSLDGGLSFSAPVQALGAQGRDAGTTNRGPRIAVDAQKRIYVSAPISLGPPDAALPYDFYFVTSIDKGKTWSKPHPISEPKTGTECAHAAASGPADFHVAWLSTSGTRPPALSYAKFAFDGKKNGKTITLSANPCEACPPAIWVDGKGTIAVAWRESNHDAASKENREIFIAWSADSGKTFGPSARLNSIDSGIPDCPSEAPALASTIDGKTWAAAWMDRRDIERDANIYWAFGAPGKFCRDTDPHDDRRYIQRRPTLAIEPDGTVWCAWEDGRLSTQRIFFATTKGPVNYPVGTDKEGGCFSPSLAAGGGKVGLVYQNQEGVVFRVLQVPR